MLPKIREFALKCLARREYGVQELKRKSEKKFPEYQTEIQEIIADLEQKNLLSDKRFCEAFIRHQVLTTKSGPHKIFPKLLTKGISKDLAQEKLDEFFSTHSPDDMIRALAKKKGVEIKRRKPNIEEFELKQKVFRFLVGKGFDFDRIKKIEPDVFPIEL